MKNILLSIIFLGLTSFATAQRIQTTAHRALSDYEMKLDSVIGSDDFDFTRWKECYSYAETTGLLVKEKIRYEWEGLDWAPKEKTETTILDEEASAQINTYRWSGEDWVFNRVTNQQYSLDVPQQILTITSYTVNDSLLEGLDHTTYEYDEQHRIALIMYYDAMNDDGEWIERSKYSYHYNTDGLLDTMLYSTIRNGSWRDSERRVYTYGDNQRCEQLVIQSKGGWGPGANQWRDSQRYEFSYQEDGTLESETYYYAGWFSSDMTLDSRTDYDFDANGNMQRKTVNIFNESDWIVRDVFENTFDATVAADKVLGLDEVWTWIEGMGMGSMLNQETPLLNLWRSCAIASQQLDTEFTLYCSSFTAVEEQQETNVKVYSDNGHLVVESQEPVEVTVYDLTGRVVARRPQETSCSVSLTPGLYLVKAGNEVVKTTVR